MYAVFSFLFLSRLGSRGRPFSVLFPTRRCRLSRFTRGACGGGGGPSLPRAARRSPVREDQYETVCVCVCVLYRRILRANNNVCDATERVFTILLLLLLIRRTCVVGRKRNETRKHRRPLTNPFFFFFGFFYPRNVCAAI